MTALLHGLLQKRSERPSRSRDALVKRCAPEGIRTPNLLIRSQMLYPLSYGCLPESLYRLCWGVRESIGAAGGAWV
jgi:hypothetical protein